MHLSQLTNRNLSTTIYIKPIKLKIKISLKNSDTFSSPITATILFQWSSIFPFRPSTFVWKTFYAPKLVYYNLIMTAFENCNIQKFISIKLPANLPMSIISFYHKNRSGKIMAISNQFLYVFTTCYFIIIISFWPVQWLPLEYEWRVFTFFFFFSFIQTVRKGLQLYITYGHWIISSIVAWKYTQYTYYSQMTMRTFFQFGSF